MKKWLSTLGAAVLALTFATAAFADSSGSFSADISTTACTINGDGSLSTGNNIGTLTATLQTPNSSQTTILIRPSYVTGLYTDTQVSKNSTTSITSSTVCGN